MTLFWIVCAVLLIVALLFVVLPLWRATANNNDVLRDAANLEILRDQSAELETDLRNGLLTQEAFEQGKRELQARLLEEVKTTGQSVKLTHNPAKVLAVVLAVLLPLLAVPLYLTIGNPKAMLQQEVLATADGFGIVRSEAALQELEKKMERMPENPDGWLLLARSYAELQRFPDAVRAYQKLVQLVPNEAQLWADYADATAMNNNQSLKGEPTKFLDKALALDGNNTAALALSGSAAMERGDYAAAITHWQKLVDLLPQDYPNVQMIHDGIKQAKEFLAMQKGGKQMLAQIDAAHAAEKAAAANPAMAISGKVALSPALTGKVAPTDTVFVLARAANGPKMPLAVFRKQVKDLPLAFTLDDSMAMQPQLKLSGFSEVVVVARVSKSGTPMAQPGDLQGTTASIKPGTKGLNIVIDTVVQ
ncbi:c-type cytochrome biogenesis protein CcmI [Ferrigenium kumadai]|uniref:C-type cytochrome biogenesis protein CcmI n=1 Tax=Ferrigenium kumadai TaxID=1682490 RepID=A0AAN1SYZ5_9PROT|nr:c-type cytochrome biogenesis protein CcmI [Ferrigenium kumadai]BBI99642.1 c-type cytochrome biogenesis protein CcmI [Ferrigenium kumadai]